MAALRLLARGQTVGFKPRAPAAEPHYFATGSAFRDWLEQHHGRRDQLWVGFYKKASGIASINWPEARDQALCFGWIDGLRKAVDEERYKIRFTPRRRGSTWSAVNLERIKALDAGGQLKPKGLRAYRERDPERAELYSYERKNARLGAEYQAKFESDASAWSYFSEQPPHYRRACAWWVVSAKRKATRLRRLGTLIGDSASHRWIKELRRPGK